MNLSKVLSVLQKVIASCSGGGRDRDRESICQTITKYNSQQN